MSTAAKGLRPASKIVKMINIEAMEFLEAKKPLVVEIRPVIARASEASPIIGAKNTDSILPLQEKNGKKASLILEKYLPQEKSSIKVRDFRVSGWRSTSRVKAEITVRVIIIPSTKMAFGIDFTIKRRCGWIKA